ncbi:hypothetical protein G7046_g1202 [Stylonectria norvegica]|nr:hypothetical protein G7046_g1202 [Stylonectria norvegica]
MCEECSNNGPKSIAGVPIEYYNDRITNNERYRLKLCPYLQSQLLFHLCKRNKTPEDNVRADGTLAWQLWKDCGLNFKYEHTLGPVLRVRFMEKAKELLKEADRWGAFKPVGNGKARRLLWNNAVVGRHFAKARDVALWMDAKKSHGRKRAIKNRHRSSDASQPDEATEK